MRNCLKVKKTRYTQRHEIPPHGQGQLHSHQVEGTQLTEGEPRNKLKFSPQSAEDFTNISRIHKQMENSFNKIMGQINDHERKKEKTNVLIRQSISLKNTHKNNSQGAKNYSQGPLRTHSRFQIFRLALPDP